MDPFQSRGHVYGKEALYCNSTFTTCLKEPRAQANILFQPTDETEGFGIEAQVPLSANVHVETIRPHKFQGISPPLGDVTPRNR